MKFEDIDLINYIINEEKTLKDAALFFDVSVDTIKKRMSKIKKELKEGSIILDNLNQVSNKNTLEGRQKGGMSNNSGSKREISIEEIEKMAINMLANDYTLEELSSKYSIPSSTIYDYLELLNCKDYQEIYLDIKNLYQIHKYRSALNLNTDLEKLNIDPAKNWVGPNQKSNIIELERLKFKYSQKLEERKPAK